MACFALAILLGILCVIPQRAESLNRRESSSTINKLLSSDTAEPEWHPIG